MTQPLTPADCDVRGLPYMPFEVGRFLDSDLFALSTGDELKAALALWCKSWTQVPAASLPADERLLARAACVSLADWRGLSEMALRGWILCADSRLYHPVVAEKALRGWIERIGMKERSAKGNATRYDTFNYDPGAFAKRKAAAVQHLARLVSHAESEFGVILSGEADAPSGTRPAPSGSPIASEQNVTEQNVTEVNGRDKALVGSPSADPTPDVQAALDLYNETARNLGLPTARVLTKARRKKLADCLSLHGDDGWREALTALASSPHCRGQNDRQWRADLDFLLTPSRFVRLIEGTYAGKEGGSRSSGGSGSYLDLALEGGLH